MSPPTPLVSLNKNRHRGRNARLECRGTARALTLTVPADMNPLRADSAVLQVPQRRPGGDDFRVAGPPAGQQVDQAPRARCARRAGAAAGSDLVTHTCTYVSGCDLVRHTKTGDRKA
jgi:hypothetical protein